MDLWEFNACVNEYVKMQEENADKDLALAWHIGAFVGQAFNGKLRKLSNYKREKSQAPTVSKDEFEERLAMAEGR